MVNVATCSKMMCRKCVELHRNTRVTRAHSLFDVDVEKDVECKAHPGEVVRFFCEPCEACICVLCTFQEHKVRAANHHIRCKGIRILISRTAPYC